MTYTRRTCQDCYAKISDASGVWTCEAGGTHCMRCFAPLDDTCRTQHGLDHAADVPEAVRASAIRRDTLEHDPETQAVRREFDAMIDEEERRPAKTPTKAPTLTLKPRTIVVAAVLLLGTWFAGHLERTATTATPAPPATWTNYIPQACLESGATDLQVTGHDAETRTVTYTCQAALDEWRNS